MADELAQPRKPTVDFVLPVAMALDIGYWFVMSRGAILPEAGGWAAQTEATKHDLQVYLAGLSYAKWEYARDHGWLPGPPKGDAIFEDTPRDWTAMA